MRKIIVFESLTLDGVMQAPGRPDEDRRGGFTHGGWAAPYTDPVIGSVAAEGMSRGSALLFGRRTYQDFASVWPSMPQPNPFTEVLNNSQKYVVSRTLTEPLPWMNSILLKGEAASTVAKLKHEPGLDLVILGSGELVRTLILSDLINQYVLLIHPLIMGTGKRLFPDGNSFSSLHLVDVKTASTGVLIATYEPAESGKK
jgi:dihydrofolate reductase